MSFTERLREIHEADWQPVSTPALAGASALVLIIIWLGSTGQRWVWILDSANLAFHEAGHPLFGLFSNRLMVGCEHRSPPLSGSRPTAILKAGSARSASQSLPSG